MSCQFCFIDLILIVLHWQDFLGQAHCTLGEVVGSLGSRIEKSLGWVMLCINDDPTSADWWLTAANDMSRCVKTSTSTHRFRYNCHSSIENWSQREMHVPGEHPLNFRFCFYTVQNHWTGQTDTGELSLNDSETYQGSALLSTVYARGSCTCV